MRCSSTALLVTPVSFQEKITPHEGCLSQILMTCAGTQSASLAAMAYDRHVAIFHLLQFLLLVSLKFCVHSVAGTWICALVTSALAPCGPDQLPSL